MSFACGGVSLPDEVVTRHTGEVDNFLTLVDSIPEKVDNCMLCHPLPHQQKTHPQPAAQHVLVIVSASCIKPKVQIKINLQY